jgi:hypothetical protein
MQFVDEVVLDQRVDELTVGGAARVTPADLPLQALRPTRGATRSALRASPWAPPSLCVVEVAGALRAAAGQAGLASLAVPLGLHVHEVHRVLLDALTCRVCSAIAAEHSPHARARPIQNGPPSRTLPRLVHPNLWGERGGDSIPPGGLAGDPVRLWQAAEHRSSGAISPFARCDGTEAAGLASSDAWATRQEQTSCRSHVVR